MRWRGGVKELCRIRSVENCHHWCKCDWRRSTRKVSSKKILETMKIVNRSSKGINLVPQIGKSFYTSSVSTSSSTSSSSVCIRPFLKMTFSHNFLLTSILFQLFIAKQITTINWKIPLHQLNFNFFLFFCFFFFGLPPSTPIIFHVIMSVLCSLKPFIAYRPIPLNL